MEDNSCSEEASMQVEIAEGVDCTRENGIAGRTKQNEKNGYRESSKRV